MTLDREKWLKVRATPSLRAIWRARWFPVHIVTNQAPKDRTYVEKTAGHATATARKLADWIWKRAVRKARHAAKRNIGDIAT